MGKKVEWQEGTVDNEHMGKKKSKCCCIYVKPKKFGESSSEDEDECDNCHGHVERKKKNKKHDTSGEYSSDGCALRDPTETVFLDPNPDNGDMGAA
jgi:protein phosphatase 1 regulatory subunit 11